MVKTTAINQINLKVDDRHDHFSSIAVEMFRETQNYDCIFKTSGGSEILCHKFVLAISSDFFKEILENCHEEKVYLTLPDVKSDILSWAIDFIYSGEISIPHERRVEFIEVCHFLKLKATENVSIDDEEEPTYEEDICLNVEVPSTNDDVQMVVEMEECEKPDKFTPSSSVKVQVDKASELGLTRRLENLVEKTYITWNKDSGPDLSRKDHKACLVMQGHTLVKGLYVCALCHREISVVYTTDKYGKFKQWVNSNMRRHLLRIHEKY